MLTVLNGLYVFWCTGLPMLQIYYFNGTTFLECSVSDNCPAPFLQLYIGKDSSISRKDSASDNVTDSYWLAAMIMQN